MGNPSCKGIGMVATVDALLADRARFEPHLRPELRRHLDHRPVASRWYPAEEIVGLLDALVAGDPMPNLTRQQTFELFGVMAVHRDMAADQGIVPRSRRSALSGVYEGAIHRRAELPTVLRRMAAGWQLYWDEGEHLPERVDPRTLGMRMVGCAPTLEELCWLHTGFYRAALELLEVPAKVMLVSCTARGDASCRWHLQLDVPPEVLADFPEAPPA